MCEYYLSKLMITVMEKMCLDFFSSDMANSSLDD